MICFDVYRNGEKLCRAGMKELSVMTGILAFVGAEHQDEPLTLSVGGLYKNEAGDQFHPKWLHDLALKEGDEITIRIVRSDTSDQPTTETAIP